ncbi:hypothetical protein MNB_SV-6-579 [hydrothermal vent metagenome]|uniref:DUF937 domain-containing protein n=1 Tax=hydrothermal vent metagenome TaxID=652676 RepID=A0A1W1CBQ8_9ZZZZ
MEFSDILNMGASLIQNSSDDSTTEIDGDTISSALNNLIGDGNGGIDLSSLVSNFSSNGLGDVVTSWLDSGENSPISADQISDLFSSDKISEFASSLGVSEESAKSAIADTLPHLIDNATKGEESIVSQMLDSVGGMDGAMNMLGKIFR